MRKIKFRAWHSTEEWMLYDSSYSFETGRRAGYLTIRDKFGEVIIGNCPTVMQYTGLKDKNGKEIYEDDLVVCTDDPKTPAQEVTFEEGMFMLGDFPLSAIETSIEVVGNVYENPELLT